MNTANNVLGIIRYIYAPAYNYGGIVFQRGAISVNVNMSHPLTVCRVAIAEGVIEEKKCFFFFFAKR